MLNSKFDLYKTEWLDLVFADRNKSYGAYDLRNHYGDNMMKALAITVLGFTVAAISFTIAFRHDVVPETTTTIINITKPIVQPPKLDKVHEAKVETQPKKATPTKTVIPAQSNVTTKKFLPPVVTTDPVTTEPPKLNPTDQISSVDFKADPSKPAGNILDAGVTPGKETGPPASVEGPVDNSIHMGVDLMPEPFGGAAAWSKFIQRTLRYPETDMEGRVTISFIVEKDGHLSDIQILKGISAELDREALRVIKLAPAWKPGKQNGQPVRVRYTIPIVFQMNQ
jgi:protein TonB